MAKTDSMASGLISSTPFDDLKQLDASSPSAVADTIKKIEKSTKTSIAEKVDGIRPNNVVPKITKPDDKFMRNVDRQLLMNNVKSSMGKAGVNLEEMPLPLNSSLISGLATAMCNGDESTIRSMFGNIDAISSLEALAAGIYSLRDKFGKPQLDSGRTERHTGTINRYGS